VLYGEHNHNGAGSIAKPDQPIAMVRILCAIVVTLVACVQAAEGGYISQAVPLAGDRLVSEQDERGSWPGEDGYVGSIVPGLLNAYRLTGTEAYKTAAEAAGEFILDSSGGNYYGDEAYALTRLSEYSDNPQDNTWRSSLRGFYNVIADWGTQDYIDAFAAAEDSLAVFYLAHHAVAAHYVDNVDRLVWRDGVISALGQVEDGDDYPVMSLGVAVWALAQTGPMDATPVYPEAPSGSYWDGVTLADLPGLLASHQVPVGQEHAKSFYWRFDHTNGGFPGHEVAGYTEDAVFAALGLIAAQQADPTLDFTDRVRDARVALAAGAGTDGRVYEHIWLGGEQYHAFGGELLHAMPATAVPGDANWDGEVGVQDLAILATNWLLSPAVWEQGNFNGDTIVNVQDLAILASNWGVGAGARAWPGQPQTTSGRYSRESGGRAEASTGSKA